MTKTVTPPAYGTMEPDALVEHLLDDGGLVRFVDVQMRGVDVADWDWIELARRVRSLTRKHWEPSPMYLRDVYAMQKERAA